MSSISQGLVLATAMVVSSTALVVAYRRQKAFPPPPLPENQAPQQPEKKVLRSCLCSEEKKRERKEKKKVHFAENVKEPSGNGKEYRKGHMKSREIERSCRNNIGGSRGMPANRIALYNGILSRDRLHRTQCSY